MAMSLASSSPTKRTGRPMCRVRLTSRPAAAMPLRISESIRVTSATVRNWRWNTLKRSWVRIPR